MCKVRLTNVNVRRTIQAAIEARPTPDTGQETDVITTQGHLANTILWGKQE